MSRSVSGSTAPTPCALAQGRQRVDVAGVVHRRHRHTDVCRVLRRRQRRGVGDERVRQRREARDDVIALARARQQYRRAVLLRRRRAHSSPSQPPACPLYRPEPPSTIVERAPHDPRVERQRAVLDVVQVELDPLRPRQRCTAVDLRPARDAGLQRKTASLALAVLGHLHRQRRARANQRHVAAQHVRPGSAAHPAMCAAATRPRA